MLVDRVDDGHWRGFSDVVVDGFKGFHAADVVYLGVEVEEFRLVLGEDVEVACPFRVLMVGFVFFEGAGEVFEGDVFVVSYAVGESDVSEAFVVVAFLVEANVDVVHHCFGLGFGYVVHLVSFRFYRPSFLA